MPRGLRLAAVAAIGSVWASSSAKIPVRRTISPRNSRRACALRRADRQARLGTPRGAPSRRRTAAPLHPDVRAPRRTGTVSPRLPPHRRVAARSSSSSRAPRREPGPCSRRGSAGRAGSSRAPRWRAGRSRRARTPGPPRSRAGAGVRRAEDLHCISCCANACCREKNNRLDRQSTATSDQLPPPS